MSRHKYPIHRIFLYRASLLRPDEHPLPKAQERWQKHDVQESYFRSTFLYAVHPRRYQSIEGYVQMLTILLSGPLRAIALFGYVRGHSLRQGPPLWTGAKNDLDALPRTSLALDIGVYTVLVSIRRGDPQGELFLVYAIFLWIVNLLFFPHGKHNGGDLSRNSQPGQVGFGSVGKELFVVCPKPFLAFAANDRYGSPLEDRFGLPVEVLVQTAGLEHPRLRRR